MKTVFNFERDARAANQWVIVAFFAAFIFWGFGYETVWQRLTQQIDGTIISRRDIPYTGAPRYSAHYVILGRDGKEQIYEAGATDAALQRNLPIGAHIDKKWGQLGYYVNDRWVAFPKAFYGVVLLVAIALSLYAARLWWRQRH
ncbi:hypothetical protein [Rhizobium tubonense]|uniref:hypothetical protein n=1 Tax=Rhizobium tubonense TaxID=484088 RepID=UPI001FCE47E3|nr:hypothetical protein [Rhizobium tubonense]